MLKNTIIFGIVCLFSVGLIITGCNRQDNRASTTQAYPSKPITMIVPNTAGGSMDMMARSMEKAAMKYFGQPMVITNIPGGANTIGMNELAGAKPDGYTIGMVFTSAILQPLYGQTRYHYPTSLEPLVQIASSPQAVVILADKPWQNISDLVEYAKMHPGEIKYAHPGLGLGPHIVGEMFAKEAGISITQVPFRGDSESLTALLGGHVQLMISAPPAIKEYVKSGKVKVLAISSEQRLTDPILKDAATFREQGLDVVFNSWFGVGAPKPLPDDVKGSLALRLTQIINDPEFNKDMEALGMTLDYLGPEEFKNKWDNETVRLTKIIKETGIAEKIAAQKN